MRPAAFSIFHHPGAQPEIHLQLLGRCALHSPERQSLSINPAQHKAAHRKIAAGKLPFDQPTNDRSIYATWVKQIAAAAASDSANSLLNGAC